MPYASVLDRNACAARNYAGKKAYFANKHQEWKEQNPKRYAWLGQRHTCKQRAVPFRLTFKQWADWWGNDFSSRGRKMSELCMCRYGDTGAYEIGNIYMATNAENKSHPRERDECDHDDIPY